MGWIFWLIADLAIAVSGGDPADCTRRQWNAFARAARKFCRHHDCGGLLKDIRDLELCGFSKNPPDECLGRTVSDGLDRCMISGREIHFQPDCWGYLVRMREGRIVDLEWTGSCD